jgi:hypothetical protein
LVQGTAFDEDGAQCLVAALQRLLWIKKEATTMLVIHDASPGRLMIFRPRSTINATRLPGSLKSTFRSGVRGKAAFFGIFHNEEGTGDGGCKRAPRPDINGKKVIDLTAKWLDLRLKQLQIG